MTFCRPAPLLKDALVSERVRAVTARVVVKYSPALTPEFVYGDVLPDVQTCADWLSAMIEYYSRTGSARVASLIRLRSIAARITA